MSKRRSKAKVYEINSMKDFISETVKNELKNQEIEKQIKEKEKTELKELIVQSIIEAHQKETEIERENFEETELTKGYKFGNISCKIVGWVLIIVAGISAVLNLFKFIDFAFLKSLYILLTGMLFVFLSMTIKIMGKSHNTNLLLNIYSLAIALASLVTSIFSAIN